jgi:fused-like protein
VLFSLGNFCVYSQCYESILEAEPEFTRHLERLHEEVDSDEVSKKNIRRILSKIDALSPMITNENSADDCSGSSW